MSNHEFTPSQVEVGASQREPDLRRPSDHLQARSRALDILYRIKDNPRLAAATVIAILGQGYQISRTETPVLADEPVKARYEVYMPLVGRHMERSDLHPGDVPLPTSTKIPISPTPSPSATPSPTELPPTATPEVEKAVGLQDTVVGGWDTPLDPYAIKSSLAQVGFVSTVDNPIDFDTKADGTGVIRSSDGTPVAYRLKLTEPGTSGDHFFEISISDLQKAVSPQSFEGLMKRDLEQSKDGRTDTISHVFARETYLFGNPQEAKKPVADESGDNTLSDHPFGILGSRIAPIVLSQTHSNPAHSRLSDSDEIQQDGKTYGELTPIASIPANGATYWHRFINGFVELPTDSGFTLKENITFDAKGQGFVHFFYLKDGKVDSPTGFGIGILGDRLIVGSYDRGDIDGPYETDAVVAPGVIHVDVKFINEARDKVELMVTDAEGKHIYYVLDLKFPLNETNVLGVEVATNMMLRDDIYVSNLELEIPRNPDRLQNLPSNPDLQGLNKLNTHAGSWGQSYGVTYLDTADGISKYDVYQGALLDQAGAVFYDRSPILSLGKSRTRDRVIHKANDPVILFRPFQNIEQLEMISRQQAKKPDFVGILAYDLRAEAIADTGYDTSDFIKDFQAFYEGSDNAQGLLVGAPLGLIGKSGGVGDFVAGLAGSNRKPEIQAREVAKALAAAIPADAVLELMPQIDPEMPFGLSQIDSLLVTLNAMNGVDRVKIDTIIIPAIPGYPTTRDEYFGYVIAARNALNNAGYTVYIRDADGGILTGEQVQTIVSDQTTDRSGIAFTSDPRNLSRLSPGADTTFTYDPDKRVIRYSDGYFTPQKPGNY